MRYLPKVTQLAGPGSCVRLTGKLERPFCCSQVLALCTAGALYTDPEEEPEAGDLRKWARSLRSCLRWTGKSGSDLSQVRVIQLPTVFSAPPVCPCSLLEEKDVSEVSCQSLSSYSPSRTREETAQCLGAALKMFDPERLVGSGRPLEPGN